MTAELVLEYILQKVNIIKIKRKCIIICVRCNYVFLSFHFLVSNLLLLVYMVQPALTDKYIKSRRILQSQVKPLI